MLELDVEKENGFVFGADNADTMPTNENPSKQTHKKEDSQRYFVNSTYNFKWLFQKLEENDGIFQERLKLSRVSKVEYNEIGEGKGYASRIFKVEIHFTDGQIPHCVALKVPNLKCVENISQMFSVEAKELQGGNLDIKQIHDSECRFYKHFANRSRLPLPKVFAVEEIEFGARDGAILMEFMGEKGISTPRLQPFNQNQVKSLVKGVAKVVAASLELDIWELKKFERSLSTMEVIMRLVKGSAEQLLRTKPKYFEKPIRRLSRLINDISFMQYMYTTLNDELGTRPVLVHGDLWANNIFWKKNANGGCSDELLALIDWQTAHCGTVARDLSHVLIANTDMHLRKEIEYEMCEYLHDCLKSEIEARNMEMPYTLEQIKRCYRYEFVLQAIMLMMYTVGLVGTETDESDETQMLKQCCLTRLKFVLEDAIQILEMEMPKWLDEEFMVKSVTEPRSRQRSFCKA